MPSRPVPICEDDGEDASDKATVEFPSPVPSPTVELPPGMWQPPVQELPVAKSPPPMPVGGRPFYRGSPEHIADLLQNVEACILLLLFVRMH